MRARELVERRVLPSTVIALSRIDAPARLAARARRARGRRGVVELYVAFDDAASAVALLDLDARLAGRPADLVVRAVVQRGLADDPAVAAKRTYAIADAARRARRLGRELTRLEPLDPDEVAFLAGWVAAVPPSPSVTAFAVAAATELWCGAAAEVDRDLLTRLWRLDVGGEPREDAAAVRAAERRMVRRGPYDTPAAVVGGQWHFAHDRPAQVVGRLEELGWS